MLLELRGVGKIYRRGGLRVRALDGVDLGLLPGRCLAVVGPSGSGKSTLGRLALGLEEPSAGTVFFKGTPCRQLSREGRKNARRARQAVFQNSVEAVNPRFPVREIVGEPLRYFFGLRGRALADKAAELLERVGLVEGGAGTAGRALPGLLDRLPRQISGGELQRVCLARALASRPELIVLDEAVSSLDLLNQSLVLDLLEEIRRENGTAFLFITHDLRVAGRLADALAVIRDGRLACYADNVAEAAQLARLRENRAFMELAEAVPPALPGSVSATLSDCLPEIYR